MTINPALRPDITREPMDIIGNRPFVNRQSEGRALQHTENVPRVISNVVIPQFAQHSAGERLGSGQDRNAAGRTLTQCVQIVRWRRYGEYGCTKAISRHLRYTGAHRSQTSKLRSRTASSSREE